MRRWTVRILVCLVLGIITTVGVAWGLAVTVDWQDAAGRLGKIEYGDVGWRMSVDREFGAIQIHSTPVWGDLLKAVQEFDYSFLAQTRSEELITRDSLPEWSRARAEFDVAKYERSACRVATEYIYGWPGGALRCTAFPETISFVKKSRLESRFHVERNEVWWMANGERYSLVIEPGDGVRDGILFRATYNPAGDVDEFQVLPLRPIWRGFLIDAVFYSAIWCTLFFGPRTIRRATRWKRGRCPSCGYDLQGALNTGCPECGWGREEGVGS